MAVCCFIGHDEVYDVDIDARLWSAIEQIVTENETVEFLFYSDWNEQSHNTCLLSALHARSRYPDKVTITTVQFDSCKRQIPSCMLDRVISPQIPNTKSVTYYQQLQWTIQHSTHVIRYVYDTLCERNIPVIRAKDRQRLKIIDITSPETAQAILESSKLTTEKEQVIFNAVNDGCTLVEAGKLIGRSHDRAWQLLYQGSKTIKKNLIRRRFELKKAEQNGLERACGLFALGEPTYETLVSFRELTDFIISSFGIKKFYIEQKYAHSAFTFVLTERACRDVHITAVISGNVPAEDNDVDKQCCPPCNAMRCVGSAGSVNGDDNFDVIADMLERLCLCICNSSYSDNAEKIRAYAAHAERAALVDISKSNNI